MGDVPDWVKSKPAAGSFAADQAASEAAMASPEAAAWRRRILQQEIDSPANPGDAEAAKKELESLPPAGRPAWVKAKAVIPGSRDVAPPAVEPPSPLDEAKRIPLETAKNLASVGDMLLSVPHMALAFQADLASRIDSLVRGRAPKEAGELAGAERNRILGAAPHIFTSLMATLAGEKLGGPSDVDAAMGKVTTAIESAGEHVESATKGLLKKEDVVSVVNETFALFGVKGAAFGAKALTPKEKPAAKPSTIDPPSAESTALTKAKAGQGFLMTAEEKIALRKTAQDSAKAADDATVVGLEEAVLRREERLAEFEKSDDLVAEAATPENPHPDTTPLWNQAAKAAVVGGAAAGLTVMFPEEDGKDLVLGTLGAGLVLTGDAKRIAAHPDTTPLGVLKQESYSTLKTIERLDEKAWQYKKDTVEQRLRQSDVSKAEQTVMRQVLDSVPGDSITAKQLMLGYKQAVGDFELKAKETQEYAHYGLEEINRINPENVDETARITQQDWHDAQLNLADQELQQRAAAPADATFNGFPRFPSQARMILDNARRTVEEYQRQTATELEAPPARTTVYQLPEHMSTKNLEEAIAKLPGGHTYFPDSAGHTRSFDEGGIRHVHELQNNQAQYAERALRVELDPRLAAIPGPTAKYARLLERAKIEYERIQPMLKDWYKRIIREELAGVVRNSEIAKQAVAKNDYSEAMQSLGSVEAVQQAASMDRVRFATADTVAKVEGWPDARVGIQASLDNALKEYALFVDRYGSQEHMAGIKEQRKRQIELYQKEIAATPKFGKSQGIYDRYKGDVEKFLRGLGGKEVTDSAGHTWLEVPVRPEMRRAAMFGGASPEVLGSVATIGLSAAAGSYFAGDKRRGAVIGASLGALGLVLRSKVPAVRLAGEATLNIADKGLGLVSTRVMNISLPLARTWSDLEHFTLAKTYKALEEVHPFVKAINGLSKAEQREAIKLWAKDDVAGWNAFVDARPDLEAAWPSTRAAIIRLNFELGVHGLHSALAHGFFPKFGADPRATPAEVIATFARAAVRETEKAKFFGESAVVNKPGTSLNVPRSVAKFIAAAKEEHGLTVAQTADLGGMLRARFGPGEHGGNKFLQDIRNVTYTGLLANPVSGLVQLTDIPVQVGLRGIGPTLEGVGRALTGKKNMSIREMGLLNHITEEFAGERLSTKGMKAFFKASFFTAFDTFSKDVVVNAAFAELRSLARRDPAAMQARFERALGPADAKQLISDFNAGEKTDLVHSVIFSELSRTQPVSRMEMSQAYLEHPNGRTLWMLKSYGLKQVDVLRREAYNEIKAGNTARGLMNLGKLSAAFMIAGASQDWIRDFLLGRGFNPKVTDFPSGMFQTMGLSDYVGSKVKSGKIGEAVVSMMLPPVSMLQDVVTGNERAVSYLPLGGKLWYSHFGGGKEKWKAWQQREKGIEKEKARLKRLSPAAREQLEREKAAKRKGLIKRKAAEYDKEQEE